MANIKFSVSLFVCHLVLAQFDSIVCVESDKCDKNAISCDHIFPEITENASKSIKDNVSNDGGSQVYQPLDNLMLEYNSNYESTLLRTIGAKVSQMIPPFDASRNERCSSKCKLHTKLFIDSLKNFELWAYQMLDASAKIPSGILNGNMNQYGDFDQCLNVNAPNDEFSGKYCLTYVQLSVSDHMPQLKRIQKLVQSHDAFVNNIDDPGHRVPRFQTLNWALCVPSSCSNIDVEIAMNDYMKNFTANTGIGYEVRVEQKMCQVKETWSLDRNTKIAIVFFVGVVGIVVVSTVLEFCVHKPNDLLVAFSLWKNTKSLISMKRNPSDIGTIHGIRFINAILLVISHKTMAVFFNPHVNRTTMIEALGEYISVIGRAAALYTDVFLLLSGLLTSYSIIGRLQRKQSPRIFQEYISRFIRIVPTLGALIIFCTYIFPIIGSGPQWNLVVNSHAENCKQYWWRNLLFIHNYYGFDKMCLTHTHHLGIDTELFVVAPALILILWKWPKNGSILLLTLAGISTVMRFHVTVAEQLSNYVYFGASIKTLFRTADLMYSIPVHRATIYIVGILVGYAMRTYINVKISKTHIFYGWTVSFVLIVSVLMGPAPMGSINYQYNAYHAAFYAALGPVGWCTLFIWIIYTTHIGYSTFISDVLSWKGFLISTRLSYAIYLTQFPIFFYNVGTMRHSGYYHYITTTVNLYEYGCILIASVVLTLLFDLPFQNIKNYIFRSTSTVRVNTMERENVPKKLE